MAIYDAFPYTNIHELNLAWCLKQLKSTQEYLDLLKAYLDEVQPELEDFKAKYPELADIADLFTVSGNNASIAGTMTASGFIGNATSATTARHATEADHADTADAIAGAQNEYRKLTYNKYHLFTMPVALNSWFDKLFIYESNDKVNYRWYMDVEALKNSGGNTVYVDKSSTGTDAGTQANPYKTVRKGFQNTNNGDTILVAKGIYYKNDLPPNVPITMNNVNLICEKGTIFCNGDALTWAQDGTYTNVYKATRSNVSSVIDIRNMDKDVFSALVWTNSVAACSNTLGSWYLENNTTLYVNIGEAVTNDKVVAALNVGYIPFDFKPDSQDMHIYMENAICFGSASPLVKVSSTSSYDCEFIAKNCKFLFGDKNSTYDGLSVLGAKTVLIGCEASFTGKDGFNYHAQGSKVCYGIEIDCVGNSNGIGSNTPYTYNGSTAHDGCQVVRINGTYINNKGANVADVQSNTISVNINCMAFDSVADTDTLFDTDFCVQQAGATMYLYNCYARGYSWRNLYNIDGGSMYVSNCAFDSSEGNITQI